MSSTRRRSRSPRLWRKGSIRALASGLATIAVVATTLSLTGSPVSADPSTGKDKINAKLSKQLDNKGEATFWVRFAMPDLSAASKIKDWDKRGQEVYDTLTRAAESSQKDAVALLEQEGADYRTFWASNAIRVQAGDEALVTDLSAMTEVKGLYPTFEYRLEKPTKGKVIHAKQSIEWGVDNINANDVWDQYGDRGEGMVIANIDTGVDFEHPALVNQYRGNNGDGTFDHNYNWFDAAGTCGDAPCDVDAHGSHTMGTMVGSDGADNEIGVAPGATWIAANGCCPSDAALIESGQWMLAPLDLNGENPDVSKRPNIINNSWGTQSPSNDPFMEDVEEAWAASGIFGTWSNGNNGSGCETSGSPGSRILNYSVGAYDVNNDIAGFSSRGAGQDGEIKPNISAPGVNVRSSVPGGGYASYNGTSMAAPHLAGSIALLWSAAPSLVGDIDATRALLDDSATDRADAQCGGTEADNNVYGEGRLDALALIAAAPVGETGTVTGTVTDSASGDVINGATVELVGETGRTITTGADGTYNARLTAGDYTATVSKFGFETATADVTITAETTTTQDFALTPAASVNLSGTVTDGSGHDWPLHAKVTVPGAEPVFTDPETGSYEISVPGNATYDVSVEAQYPGYLGATRAVEVGGSDTTADFAVEVNSSTCEARGYAFNVEGTTEDFDSGSLPDGWTVTDEAGTEQTWLFDNPDGRDNLTGGTDGFAIADSDYFGSGGTQDTSLVSPVVDMSSVDSPVVGFKQDYNNLGDVADVDVSIDGGATWETVLSQTTDVRGPREDILELPTAAGQAAVQVRFHYYEADYDWWWQVDDVFLGSRTCDPVEGGLVVGNVTATNTGEGINGAAISSTEDPEVKTTTRPTPDDENLADGFYSLFSPQVGDVELQAASSGFETGTATVAVAANGTVRQDFALGSGHLVVTPGEVSATRQLGKSPVTRNVEVTNDGDGAVQLEFFERKGGFEILSADGSRTTKKQLMAAEGAPLRRLAVDTSFGKQAPKSRMGTNRAPAVNGPHDDPWTDIADYPSNIMDNRAVRVDGIAYSIAGGDGSASTSEVNAYDPATLAWTSKAPLPDARNAVAAGAVGGQVIVTGGWAAAGPSPSTWAYDPSADAWTAVADAPVELAASGQAVVDGKLYVVGGCTTAACTPMSDAVAAYDPASDSWETLASYPSAVAFASCGGIDGKVYCTGGNDGGGGTAASYVYDPAADSWTAIGDAPIDTWASQYAVANGTLVVNGGVQAGAISNRTFAFDAAEGAWIDLPNSNTPRYRGSASCGVYKVGGSSGSFNAAPDSEMLPGLEDCGAAAADVEWLSISPATATLAPGQTVTLKVTLDPNVAQPGTYTASVGIKEDTPFSVEPVAVTMVVDPPRRWGKLAGTVTGTSCQDEDAAIPGATVQANSDGLAWTFETDADGTYARWFDTYYSPLQLIAAKDGFVPATKRVKLRNGKTSNGDFDLKEAGCQ
ncbi:S8 family serine peptidase [Nocardioides sp. JQ2195]|uniref:S8 family serine peptidase n=1 Tax=Nocardioides sp. JQ2195 TaxID=2592334 RepID=UPI00143EEA1A|nr:S8 family serine peptidase [Nocardioides sp. JQ2195]QIX27284.1 S8 family serine peptidase [Nocardioides sp. JQ2195]